jgi:hypothetical protein
MGEALKKYTLLPPPPLSLLPSCYEVSIYALQHALTQYTLPHHRPTNMEPVDHRLKP